MTDNNTPGQPDNAKDTPKKVTFFIDKEKFETTQPDQTVRALIADFAKENPAETTLALKHGNELAKYTNLDAIVHLENGMHFVIFHNTPTVVS